MSKDFIRMQKLAGVITESQFKSLYEEEETVKTDEKALDLLDDEIASAFGSSLSAL